MAATKTEPTNELDGVLAQLQLKRREFAELSALDQRDFEMVSPYRTLAPGDVEPSRAERLRALARRDETVNRLALLDAACDELCERADALRRADKDRERMARLPNRRANIAKLHAALLTVAKLNALVAADDDREDGTCERASWPELELTSHRFQSWLASVRTAELMMD